MEKVGIFTVQQAMIASLKGMDRRLREDVAPEFCRFQVMFDQAIRFEEVENGAEFKKVGANSATLKEGMLEVVYAIKDKIIASKHSKETNSTDLDSVIEKLIASIETTQEKFGGQTKWRDLLEQARNETALKDQNQR